MSEKRLYRSRFIVDVELTDDSVTLIDSNKTKYNINCNKENAALLAQFTLWFKNIFSKGISLTLTVFLYDKILSEDGTEYIYNFKKFVSPVMSEKDIAEIDSLESSLQNDSADGK